MSEDRTAAEGEDAGDLDTLDDLLGIEPDVEDLDAEPPGEAREEPQAPPPPRPTREVRRVQALQQRLKEQEDENRRMREAWVNTPRPTQPVVDPYRQAEMQRLEAERVAAMMPQDQAQYYASQTEQRVNNQILRARIEVGDLLDRQTFRELMRDEPLARQWEREIENDLAAARNQGQNPTREVLYNLRLAQYVRDKSRRDADRQRRNGRAAIARQTTQPGNGRSTAVQPRRPAQDDDAALDERLRNTTLGDSGW